MNWKLKYYRKKDYLRNRRSDSYCPTAKILQIFIVEICVGSSRCVGRRWLKMGNKLFHSCNDKQWHNSFTSGHFPGKVKCSHARNKARQNMHSHRHQSSEFHKKWGGNLNLKTRAGCTLEKWQLAHPESLKRAPKFSLAFPKFAQKRKRKSAQCSGLWYDK